MQNVNLLDSLEKQTWVCKLKVLGRVASLSAARKTEGRWRNEGERKPYVVKSVSLAIMNYKHGPCKSNISITSLLEMLNTWLPPERTDSQIP